MNRWARLNFFALLKPDALLFPVLQIRKKTTNKKNTKHTEPMGIIANAKDAPPGQNTHAPPTLT